MVRRLRGDAVRVQLIGSVVPPTDHATASQRYKDDQRLRTWRRRAGAALMVWSETLRNPVLAGRLEEAIVSMSRDITGLVHERQEAGAFTSAPANMLARVILSILPGFLLNLALPGPHRAAGFPDAVRTLWPR